MSVAMMSAVWTRDLPATEKLLLLCLADFSDDTGRSFPSVGRLAWKIGVSERQTQRLLRRLERQGVVSVVQGRGRHSSRVYRIDPERATALPDLAPAKNGDPSAPVGTTKSAREGLSQDPEGRHPCHPMGDTHVTPGVTPMSPYPSYEPSGEPSEPLPSPPRAARAAKDSRHYPLRQAIEGEFQTRTGYPCQWAAREGAELARVLSANPALDLDQLTRAVKNRFSSEVNHADPPYLWLGRLPSYLAGPLDRYGKPKNPLAIGKEAFPGRVR